MGYHTLTQRAGETLAEAVAADLGGMAPEGPVVRAEQVGACIVHTILATVPDAHVWVASRVENGMVKHMSEDMGPYVSAPSRAFVDEAIRLCEGPPGVGFRISVGFRAAMLAGRAYRPEN